MIQNCCGNSLSMSTVNANASMDQSVCCCCGCGGASNVSSALNAIGKWGTILTATVQGKPVVTNRNGVAVGARGASSVTSGGISGNALLILALVAVAVFFLMRR